MMNENIANFIGREGFNWWIGQVENDGRRHWNASLRFGLGGWDYTDWDWTNKVKVRIVGYHNPNRKELPTTDLPWAQVLMPPIYSMRSGMGSIHQLQINSWVIGFFMDGTSAQIPVVMGSLADENPGGGYGVEGGKEEGFAQLVSPDYEYPDHSDDGSSAPNTGSTIETNEETGVDEAPKNNDGHTHTSTDEETGEETDNTTDDKNERGPAKLESEKQAIATEKQKVTVQVGNGKCGSETATKLEGPLAEFMKFARGVEKNDIDQFINKLDGSVVDMDYEINIMSQRIQKKLTGLTANIKGVVMEETNKLVQDGLDELSIPNPELDTAVRKQLKDVGDLVSCLFKQLLGELGDFIKGMLSDLVENVLDTALCLVQNFLGEIMKKLMDKIQSALGILKGVTGAIKGAAQKIQNLLNKVLDFIDLFCDGELSCAIGASVFETGVGAKAKGNDAAAKNKAQYKVKPPNSVSVVGNGKPKNGFVPVVDKNGIKKVFNTKTGALSSLDSATGLASGLSEKSFDTRGPLEKFEGINFYDSSGNIASQAVNCSSANRNKKPCFPEMVWDNLQSTSPVKALPIIDDIGQILGVFMQKKGSDVGLEARVRAQFTCNEPEGSGAKFKPNIVDGKVESIDVINPGIGYGFDPADTFCPKEQYAVTVPKAGLQQFVNDGEYLEQVTLGNPDVLQVVDTDYSEDDMLIATIDPSFNPNFVAGLQLKTKSGHEFTLNFNSKFPTLVIPPNAKALYAGCGDVIPKLDDVKITNVGSNYKDPKICIGVGDKEKCIGTATTDKDGKLISVSIDVPVLGFVKPEIVDSQGTGARLSTSYIYTSPREIKETNVLPLTQYIDCVGHPMITFKEDEEDTTLQDSAFNLVDGQDTSTTTDGDTTTTVSTPTVADPVSTPVNQDTTQPTQQTQQQQTQQTPPSTPPAQNNPPNQGGNQGGYGGY
jgi:hypothetical protein